jgi:pimeloyl-ACP methyl ester carboxylesterase
LHGHGETPPLSGEASFRALADSTEFINDNNLNDVDAVGSSMGARLVLELARRGGGLGGVVSLLSGERNWKSRDSFLKLKVAAKLCDVTLRRSAEKLFVIAAKVRWVFIAHAESGARRVQVFTEHQTACFLKSYLFLKLQKAHRRDGLEVMVKARNAHPEFARCLFNFKRLIEVFTQMPDCLGDAAGVASRRSQEVADCRPLFLSL